MELQQPIELSYQGRLYGKFKVDKIFCSHKISLSFVILKQIMKVFLAAVAIKPWNIKK